MPLKISKARRRHLLAVVASYDFAMRMELAAQRRRRIRLLDMPQHVPGLPGVHVFTSRGLVPLKTLANALHVIEPGTPVTFISLEKAGLA